MNIKYLTNVHKCWILWIKIIVLSRKVFLKIISCLRRVTIHSFWIIMKWRDIQILNIIILLSTSSSPWALDMPVGSSMLRRSWLMCWPIRRYPQRGRRGRKRRMWNQWWKREEESFSLSKRLLRSWIKGMKMKVVLIKLRVSQVFLGRRNFLWQGMKIMRNFHLVKILNQNLLISPRILRKCHLFQIQEKMILICRVSVYSKLLD